MLTETEIAFIRDVVGESPSDAELQEIYERAGTTGGVVYVVLSQQLTELIRNPANFNVSGEYSQDTRTNIEALQKRIAQFAGFAPDAEDYQPTQVRVVEPSRRRRR